MRGKVIATVEQIPPNGATGYISQLNNGKIAFIPDNPEHCPDDLEFAFYELEPEEIEVL